MDLKNIDKLRAPGALVSKTTGEGNRGQRETGGRQRFILKFSTIKRGPKERGLSHA